MRVWAQVRKELTQLTRDRLAVALALLLPLIQLTLMGQSLAFIVRDLPVVVQDFDDSVPSRELIDTFRASQTFRIISWPPDRNPEEAFADNSARGALVIPRPLNGDVRGHTGSASHERRASGFPCAVGSHHCVQSDVCGTHVNPSRKFVGTRQYSGSCSASHGRVLGWAAGVAPFRIVLWFRNAWPFGCNWRSACWGYRVLCWLLWPNDLCSTLQSGAHARNLYYRPAWRHSWWSRGNHSILFQAQTRARRAQVRCSAYLLLRKQMVPKCPLTTRSSGP